MRLLKKLHFIQCHQRPTARRLDWAALRPNPRFTTLVWANTMEVMSMAIFMGHESTADLTISMTTMGIALPSPSIISLVCWYFSMLTTIDEWSLNLRWELVLGKSTGKSYNVYFEFTCLFFPVSCKVFHSHFLHK